MDNLSKMLATEMSKNLINIRNAWGMQVDAFQSNIPFAENKLENKAHTFDKRSMGTAFPFLCPR